MKNLPAFPKPSQLEGRITLSQAEKTKLRIRLFKEQRGVCGCGCGRHMTMDLDVMGTATLEHFAPNKMGCKKNDSPANVFAVYRWDCNVKKGSQRLPRHV